MESVINSGHCTVDRIDSHLSCMCKYVFAHVHVYVLLECWLSCVVENIHTAKCQVQVLVSTLCTYLSVCERGRIKGVYPRVCLEIVSDS